jgi:hypothetical protein
MHSHLALYQDFDGLRAWKVEYVDAIIARTDIAVAPGDYESRLFVHAANMLNAVLEEREVGKIYRAEDLTSDSSILGDFVEEITRGTVSPSSEWLESAIRTEKVNSHAARHPQREFNQWQIEVIGKVVDPRAWEIYESLGYAPPEFISCSAANRQSVFA